MATARALIGLDQRGHDELVGRMHRGADRMLGEPGCESVLRLFGALRWMGSARGVDAALAVSLCRILQRLPLTTTR